MTRRPQFVSRCFVAAALALSATAGRAQGPVKSDAPDAAANRVSVKAFENKAGTLAAAGAGGDVALAITGVLEREQVGQVVTGAAKAGVVVRGAITAKDGKLAYRATIADGMSGKTLATIGPVLGAGNDAALALAERVAAALDGRLLWGNAQFAWPPPANFAAWKEYKTGWTDQFNKSNWAAAIPYFERAEKLDPTWLGAKYGIWVSYGNLGRTALRDSMDAVLKPLMTAIPGTVSDVYTWLHASHVRDNETMYLTGKRLAANDPRSLYSAALPAVRSGRFTEVIDLYNKRDNSAYTREWRPWEVITVLAMHVLGRYDDALALARDNEIRRGFDYNTAYLQLYNLAALGKTPEVEAMLARVKTLPITAANTLGGVLNVVGWEYRAHGFETQARDIFKRRAEFYRSLTPEQQNTYRIAMANAVLVAGDYADARTRYEALIAAAPDNLNLWANLGIMAVETHDDALFTRADARLASETRPASKSDALYYRSMIAAQKGDCSAAEKYLRDGLAAGIVTNDYTFHWMNSYGKAKACTALPALTGQRH